jgi:hypothetical protein
MNFQNTCASLEASLNFDTGSAYGQCRRKEGVSVMYPMVRLIIAATIFAFAGFSTGTLAQVAETQIKLTEKQVEGFIAVQAEIATVVEKTQGGVFSDDGKYRAELSAVTRKRGFKDFAEYETVAANISMVMAAIDPQTKAFTDPQTAIRKEIDDVSRDKTVSSTEKKQMLAELNEALKSVQPVQFPTNIELVKKYYDQIDVTDIATPESVANSSVVRTIGE